MNCFCSYRQFNRKWTMDFWLVAKQAVQLLCLLFGLECNRVLMFRGFHQCFLSSPWLYLKCSSSMSTSVNLNWQGIRPICTPEEQTKLHKTENYMAFMACSLRANLFSIFYLCLLHHLETQVESETLKNRCTCWRHPINKHENLNCTVYISKFEQHWLHKSVCNRSIVSVSTRGQKKVQLSPVKAEQTLSLFL